MVRTMMNMAENVFVLPDVGQLYNNNFISLKIDAEKGEGAELAAKYKVRSYPTYMFIDPKADNPVHRSGGNKPAKDFMADAFSAINHKTGSFYLEEQYKKGRYDADFLKIYINMKKTSGDKNSAEVHFDELIKMGAKMTDKDIWELYVDCIDGCKNPYFMEVSDNYDKFILLFGKKAVDDKLTLATTYASAEEMSKFCDFDGKELNIKLQNFSQLVYSKNYDKAIVIMDELLGNEKYNQDIIFEKLAFAARTNAGRKQTTEVAYEWLSKQVEYLRYIVYNLPERKNTSIHFEYAQGLEYLTARSIKEGKPLPAFLSQAPTKGKSYYNLSSTVLKAKPGVEKKPTKLKTK